MKKRHLLIYFSCLAHWALAQHNPQHLFELADQLARQAEQATTAKNQADSTNAFEAIDQSLNFFLKTNGLISTYLMPSEIRKRLDNTNNIILQEALESYFLAETVRNAFEKSADGQPTPYNGRTDVLKALDVTTYADAFARVIVKRFKQDLKETLFSKIYEELDNIEHFNILMPNVLQTLKLMDSDIYNPELYLSQLKTAAEIDFLNLFNNANNVLVQQNQLDTSAYNSEQMVLSLMLQMADGLIKNQHPAKIIDNWTFIKLPLDKDSRRIKNTVVGLQVAAKTLRLYTEDTTRYNWLNPNAAKQFLLYQNDLSQKITLGLIYEIAFEKDPTFAEEILQFYDKYGNNYFKLKQYLIEAAYYLNRIQVSIDEIGYIKNINDNSKKQLIEYRLLDLYQNMFELVKAAPKLLILKDSTTVLTQYWYKGIEIAEILPKLYITARTGDLKSTAFNAFSFIKTVNTSPKYIKLNIDNKDTIIALQQAILYDANKQAFNTFVKDFKTVHFIKIDNKIYPITTLYSDKTCQSIYKPKVLSPEILKYLTLLSELAEAKTTEDIEAVLDKTILPSGSSRQKETGILLGLNSYVGVQWSPKTRSTALSVPIGVNLSWGKPRGGKAVKRHWGPHTYQIFGSLVDLGAIAGLRFNDVQTPLPKIELGNILSPGLFFQTGGWFNLPVNLGLGYQQQPRLEAFDAQGQPRLGMAPYQWRAQLSWDIPLFYLKKW